MSRLWLLSVSKSRRTEVALLVGFVVLAVVVGLGAWRSFDKLSAFIELSERDRYYAIVVDGLEAALTEVLRAESEQRGYLVTGDTSFLTTYDQSIIGARQAIERLLKFTANDAALQAQVREVQQISEKRFEYLSEAVHLHRTGRPDHADEYVKLARPLSINTRTRFVEIQSQYVNALAQTREEAHQLRRDTIQAFAVSAAIAAIVLAFMAFMIVFEARFIRALSERLLHASRHDDLTRLPNRAYLDEWLERNIAAAKRANEKLALLYLDLNGFKQVNDNMGHDAGDEVLTDVARKLEATARDSDFVARLGGDEFAVVMPRISNRAQVEAASQRFAALTVQKGAHVVSASVGCAVYPDDGDSAHRLMQVSDAAMYERKQSRRRA